MSTEGNKKKKKKKKGVHNVQRKIVRILLSSIPYSAKRNLSFRRQIALRVLLCLGYIVVL